MKKVIESSEDEMIYLTMETMRLILILKFCAQLREYNILKLK